MVRIVEIAWIAEAVDFVKIVEIVWNVKPVGMFRNIDRVESDFKFKKFSLMASMPSGLPASGPPSPGALRGK
jgi:hypothetical protein